LFYLQPSLPLYIALFATLRFEYLSDRYQPASATLYLSLSRLSVGFLASETSARAIVIFVLPTASVYPRNPREQSIERRPRRPVDPRVLVALAYLATQLETRNSGSCSRRFRNSKLAPCNSQLGRNCSRRSGNSKLETRQGLLLPIRNSHLGRSGHP
jgi:hypothetical protein